MQGAMLASVPTSHEADVFLYVKLSKNLKKQRMAKLDHLARNVNLSAKAFCGIAAFAMILRECGYAEEATGYEKHARRIAESWLERATVTRLIGC